MEALDMVILSLCIVILVILDFIRYGGNNKGQHQS